MRRLLIIASLIFLAVPARADTVIVSITDGPGGEGQEGMFWSLLSAEYQGDTFQVFRTDDPFLPIGSFRVNSISVVPEPSTWAMMLLGFAGLGFVFRHARLKLAFNFLRPSALSFLQEGRRLIEFQ